MKRHEFVCIMCPMGCNLEVLEDEDVILVKGNQCKRGYEYGVKEISNPTRVLTSTVILKNSYLRRLPVKSDGEIPKGMIKDCVKFLSKIEVSAPVKMGDVIHKNILGTGVDIVSTRTVE
ncbi:hypothetical protein ABG79_00403 [Caloramator mitchellensis]|uniref:4Fe-4S Mo/W bis-MGD-type domain-containing protein n=1 Tax=Caloramator mitchellensis TaxID=908809 RepID=A0A0R3K3T3_CALMK|nr:DUF1667 domain-containing protein [Caloramator mitchellensis]KRQ87602.1 hypothetical protein ABG79_00403 [Caloramator mitchellensis]